MKLKECSLIQELFPLYAENLVSVETVAYIEKHLADCPNCAYEWEIFIQPLLDPIPVEKLAHQKDTESKLVIKLKKTVTVAVLLLMMGGAGLSYASYTVGKKLGIDDPAYRFAQELGLFTEIKQTKLINGLQVSVDKGLFDSTRSVLFINVSDSTKTMPQVSLVDENGQQFEQKRAKGWKNKYFMLEFAPIGMDTQEVTVSLVLGESQEARTNFTFPVDIVKTAQYTKIIYPNQTKELSDLQIALEKAVLGVSESEFKVRFDWPVDGSLAGIGLGRGSVYFPTSVTKISADTPPPPGMGAPPPGGLMSSYAATYGLNYRSEDPPGNRPALYDLTGRQEVEVQSGEYKSTQFPCQVLATLKFAPVKQETEQMELLLPPVYLYKSIEGSPKLHLNFGERNELNLDKAISFSQGKIIIEKAWLEKKEVYLSYRVEASAKSENILPHFKLVDIQGKKQGQLRFHREKLQVITFSLYNEEAKEFYLNFDSVGQLLPREKFALDLQEK